jgi:UDP-GlcNAc3NAcA epimerase
MKIVTVVGARPQFIKAAAVSRELSSRANQGVREILVHTGQHYDANMSAVFFEELMIPNPTYHLGIAGGRHGAMTGRMLEAVEEVLAKEKPDWVLVYGDTNSTLAATLAATKMHIRVAHVEAGLRSFNMRMPEEINRLLADRVSTLLFCPTKAAVLNLEREGVQRGIHLVGDVMFDVSLYYRGLARDKSDALNRHGVEDGRYVLATCHRAENTDDPLRLGSILKALASVGKDIPVLLPLHPRTRAIIERNGLQAELSGVTVVEPLSFLDMVRLEQSAKVIVTDSGGVQKEAFFYGIPCVTMRDETEWVETVDSGWNTLVGAHAEHIISATRAARIPAPSTLQPYGSGAAAKEIADLLLA